MKNDSIWLKTFNFARLKLSNVEYFVGNAIAKRQLNV